MNKRVSLYLALATVLAAMGVDICVIEFHHDWLLAGLAVFGALSALMCWLAETLEGGPENYPGFVYDMGLVRAPVKR